MLDNVFVVFCERIPRRKVYYVRFQINDGLINKVKDLPEETRKWNNGIKSWEINALSLMNLIKSYKGSTKIKFDFGNDDSKKIFINQVIKLEEEENEKRRLITELNANKEKWLKYKLELETTYVDQIDYVHSFLNKGITLYPHQIVSTLYLNMARNALLALDMGTGKSLVSITYVEMNKFEKVVVITPNSLKFNYLQEVNKFTQSKAHIVNWGKNGKKNKYTIEESKYIIFNYEYFNPSSLKNTESKFKALKIGKINAVISDESHRLKSSDSNTYKNFKHIFNSDIYIDGKVSKIFMTGTPAPSRASELYTVLNQISPLDFSTKKYFYEFYCGMSYNLDGYGWEVDEAATKFEELFHKISPYIYRKKKSEVLKDLPEKTYQRVLLEMNPKEYEVYYDLEEGVANEFVNRELTNAVSIMGKLREYTSYLKVKNVQELIDTILESDEKFVAIDFFKKSLRDLHDLYPQISLLHTGDETPEERANAITIFQDNNSEIKLLFGSEATTKEGLTLTAASKVGMITIPWTPSNLDQCTDRLCRIGQKNAVNAYIFIFKDTIDEYVFDLIESKRSEISQVIDGEKYESNVNQSIISDLVEIIRKKHNK